MSGPDFGECGDEYRKQFYWFQYQFFIRGSQRKRTRLGGFLFELMTAPDEMHCRWEQKKRQETKVARPQKVAGQSKSITIRRPPRGMKQAEALIERSKVLAGQPVIPGCLLYCDGNVRSTVNHAWLPHTDKKSIRCRYMLFDWLRTENRKTLWNNFPSLYRSLLVYDLHMAGYSLEKIAQSFNQEQSLAQMAGYRIPLGYEEFLRDFIPQTFDLEKYDAVFQMVSNAVNAGVVTRESFGYFATVIIQSPKTAPPKEQVPSSISPLETLEPIESPVFIRSYNNYPKASPRIVPCKIKQHYKRALKLILLAETGQFRDFTKLPTIKN